MSVTENRVDKILLTPEEAAERLSIGRTLVYELIARGAIASVRIGRARRIPVTALERYVEQLAGESATS